MIEMFLCALAPIPGLEDTYIGETYPDWNNPETGEKPAYAKLYVNEILLSCAMILRMYLLIRFLITFTRFRSARQ
jgi:hypothetical protein